jgi:GNAT superfamily N-acetyltransferase
LLTDDSQGSFTYANFNDIPDFREKLRVFFSEAQAIAGAQGYRFTPRPMVGYACIDGERIVAISFYIIPKKDSLNYLGKYLFRPPKVEMGTVIMQEYRGLGVYRELISRVQELMRKKGYVKA